MRLKNFLNLSCLIGVAVFSSCGYKLSGAKSALGQRYNKVFVKVRQNLTPHFELENKSIDAVKALLLRYKDISLVDTESKSDAVINIDLINYETFFGAIGKTGTFDIDEYNVLTYRIDLINSSGKMIWSSNEQKVSSFGALSLSAFDEGGTDTLSKGYSTKDIRSTRDVSLINRMKFFIYSEKQSRRLSSQVFLT